jgi:hypothetical protein
VCAVPQSALDQHKKPAGRVFRVRDEADFQHIPFQNGMAAVEVPARLLDCIPMRDYERGDSPRLRAMIRSIRNKGFRPTEPIQVRIGRKGRWVVVDGGHRMTAARRVMRNLWDRLMGRRIESFYFVLFLTPESWSKVGVPDGIDLPDARDARLAEERESWVRAAARRQATSRE